MGRTADVTSSRAGRKIMALNYDDVLEKYEPTLGLEVHVELSTKTKMSAVALQNLAQNLILKHAQFAWAFLERSRSLMRLRLNQPSRLV